MEVIGLTGGIACGKSTIAAMLRDLGVPVIDADAISRSLTAPGGAALPDIRRIFGSGVFAADGSLNRAALAEWVFADPAARARLNAVIHPLVTAQMQAQTELCRKQGQPIVVWDVPLLFEAGLDGLCSRTLCAVADEETQIARLQSRDGLTARQAKARIDSQMPVREKAARSSLTIDTQKPLPDLQKQVQALYHSWLKGVCHDAPVSPDPQRG